MRQPKFFIDPRTIFRRLGAAGPAAFLELPVQPPAGIAPLGDIDKPLAFLPDVAVVVHREQVAELVESQFLHVAQPGGEHLEVAAVPVAAQHATGVRVMQQSTLARANREAVVPDRKVQLPVRPDRQPVQVVTVKRSMHAEPVKKHLPFVGVAIPV